MSLASGTSFTFLALWTLFLHAHVVMATPQRWVDTLPTFIDDNKLYQVVVDHNVTGDVFVGGRNVLYHFSADLELKQNVSIGPVKDYPGCPIPPYYPCNNNRVVTDNDVRLLKLVYYFGDTPSLLLCGSVYGGLCQVRPVHDLDEYHWVHPYNESLGYITNQHLNFALFEHGFDGRLSLFTAIQDDDSIRTQNSPSFLSSKLLTKEDDRYSFQHTFQNETISSIVTIKGNTSRYPMDGGFVYGNFIYFPILYFVRTKIAGSRLVRFCTTDPTFQTYAELPIKCNYKGQVHERLLAAHLGDSRISTGKALYVSFSDSSSGSALCVFEMSSIIEAFTTSSRKCNRDVVGETCDQEGKKEIADFCGPNVSPYVVIQPLEVGFFSFIPKVIIIAITLVKQYDELVLIAGTNVGILVKISGSTGQIINVKDMLDGNTISAFTSPFVLDGQEKHIYLLVKNKVIKYPVASCAGHETCQDCFAIGKRNPLKCGWCAGRCAHFEECSDPSSFSLDTCTPSIYEVFPQKGPIQGGSTITITGNTFGSYVDDTHNSISVAGIPCAVSSWNYTEVKCTLGSTQEIVSGPVQLNVINLFSTALGYSVAGSTVSQTNFSYIEGPRLYGIRPSKGPTSGGTLVTLVGDNLDFDKDKKRFISVRGRLCILQSLNKKRASCITGNTSSINFPTETAIHIGGVAYQMDRHPPFTFNLTGFSQYFEYTPDPYISHIQPGITTLSGLMNLTVIGRHLDSVQSPKLVVKIDKSQIMGESEFLEDCWVDPKSSGTTMTCHTPSLKDKAIFPIPTRTHPCIAQVSFVMDGVQRLRDFPKHRDYLSRLLFYPDPEFKVFQEMEKLKMDQRVLEIKGTYLDLMHLADNLQVKIGKDNACKITSVSSDVLLCAIPPNLLSNSSLGGTNMSVEIFTGSTIHHLGYIEFHQQEEGNGIGYILLVVVFIVITSCVIYLGYKWCVRCGKKPLHTRDMALANNYSAVPSRDVAASSCAEVPVAVAESPVREMPLVDEETLFLLADRDLIISKKYLTLGENIGSGHFGCVNEGNLQYPNQIPLKVAVKSLHENCWSNPVSVQTFLKEALLMKDFKDPNVLKLLGVCFDGNVPSIVLPFMENKDLHSYIIDENRLLFVTDLLKFAVDVTSGMSYLEDQKFVHRDLAARNCLLDSSSNAKVADFGLSRDVYVDNYYSMGSKGKIPIKWSAPESLERRLFSTKTDVWSCGVLLWELMTRGSEPYCGVANLLKYINNGYRLDQPEFCPLPLYKAMLACWNIDSNLRPSFHELHRFVRTLRDTLLNNTRAEPLAATDVVSPNEAVLPRHTVYYNSEELYLNMNGHTLNNCKL